MACRLSIFLMGKTGNGKSATGNTILNRQAFRTSSSGASMTRDVSSSYRSYKQSILHVIDGPGLEDTELTIVKKKEAQVKDMETALAMGYGGIDAFLLVQKFGNRFTREDRSVLETLERLFGPNYFQHVIVVLTHGDVFEESMEDEPSYLSFKEWCEQQTGEFEKLYRDCSKRFVLFNNREKDEKKKDKQVQQLVQLVQDLHMQRGRYTSECFTQAQYKREELIINLKVPQLKEEIQEKISLLTARIDIFAERPSPKLKDEIQKQIDGLKAEIKQQDKGYGVLDNLLKLVEQVSQNFDDKNKLLNLMKEMEEIREAKPFWKKIGSFFLNMFSHRRDCS